MSSSRDATGRSRTASTPLIALLLLAGACGEPGKGHRTLGAALAVLGDVDGDGAPDVVVGDPGCDDGPGRVWVVSGRSGEPLHEVVGRGRSFGTDLCAGADVDGRGLPDFAVLEPALWAPRLHLFSGEDYRLLWSASAPAGRALDARHLDASFHHLAFVDDVDGDGAPDVVALVPTVDGAALHAHSGRDGRLVWKRTFDRLIADLAVLADLDGDGSADLALGAPGATRHLAIERRTAPRDDVPGAVLLVSAADGRTLRTVEHPLGLPTFGTSLGVGPDADGDGRPDLLVLAASEPTGAPGDVRRPAAVTLLSGAAATPSVEVEIAASRQIFSANLLWTGGALWTLSPGGLGQDCVFLHDLDGSLRASRSRFLEAGLGASAVVCGDLDGDGIDDVLVGALDTYAAAESSVRALSGGSIGKGALWSTDRVRLAAGSGSRTTR